MKRLITIVLVLLLGLSLISCGKNQAKSESIVIPDLIKNFIDDYNQNEVTKAYLSRSDGEELYFLSGGDGWGDRCNVAISISKKESIIVSSEDGVRYKVRWLNKNELENFIKFIKENDIDTLKDNLGGADDAMEYYYSHWSNKGISKINFESLGVGGEVEIYRSLVNQFLNLTKTGDFDVRYKSADVKVLIKSEDYQVENIWKDEDGFKVLIKENRELVWHEFDGNKLGNKTSSPNVFTNKAKKVHIKKSSKNFDDIYDILSGIKERFLQPTGKADEFYAALHGEIGKINMKTFTFTKIAQYKDIELDSMKTWVDEAGGKAYTVINNDLLELPLQKV